MAQGLQVWDSNGKVQLDTSTQTTTFLTKLLVTVPNNTTYYTNPALSQGTPFHIITPMDNFYAPYIKITVTGNTATITTKPIPSNWTSLNGKWNFQIYIGVF